MVSDSSISTVPPAGSAEEQRRKCVTVVIVSRLEHLSYKYSAPLGTPELPGGASII